MQFATSEFKTQIDTKDCGDFDGHPIIIDREFGYALCRSENHPLPEIPHQLSANPQAHPCYHAYKFWDNHCSWQGLTNICVHGELRKAICEALGLEDDYGLRTLAIYEISNDRKTFRVAWKREL